MLFNRGAYRIDPQRVTEITCRQRGARRVGKCLIVRGLRSTQAVAEPSETTDGVQKEGRENKRAEKGVEEQHRQHGIIFQSSLFGGVVQTQQGRGNESEQQPHVQKSILRVQMYYNYYLFLNFVRF